MQRPGDERNSASSRNKKPGVTGTCLRGRQTGTSWEAGEGRGAGGPSEEYGLQWKGKGEPSKILQ